MIDMSLSVQTSPIELAKNSHHVKQMQRLAQQVMPNKSYYQYHTIYHAEMFKTGIDKLLQLHYNDLIASYGHEETLKIMISLFASAYGHDIAIWSKLTNFVLWKTVKQKPMDPKNHEVAGTKIMNHIMPKEFHLLNSELLHATIAGFSKDPLRLTQPNITDTSPLYTKIEGDADFAMWAMKPAITIPYNSLAFRYESQNQMPLQQYFQFQNDIFTNHQFNTERARTHWKQQLLENANLFGELSQFSTVEKALSKLVEKKIITVEMKDFYMQKEKAISNNNF